MVPLLAVQYQYSWPRMRKVRANRPKLQSTSSILNSIQSGEFNPSHGKSATESGSDASERERILLFLAWNSLAARESQIGPNRVQLPTIAPSRAQFAPNHGPIAPKRPQTRPNHAESRIGSPHKLCCSMTAKSSTFCRLLGTTYSQWGKELHRLDLP